jgi:hypothetical protein
MVFGSINSFSLRTSEENYPLDISSKQRTPQEYISHNRGSMSMQSYFPKLNIGSNISGDWKSSSYLSDRVYMKLIFYFIRL